MKYFSEELNKNFDTIEELEAAEKAFKEENEKKLADKEARKAEIKKINDAANNYFKVVAENNKTRVSLKKAEDDAYANYRQELDDFSDRYQGYHLTYTKNGDNVEFKIEEVKQDSLDSFYKQIEASRKLFGSFFDDLFNF